MGTTEHIPLGQPLFRLITRRKNVMREILLSIYLYSFMNVDRRMKRNETNNFELNYLMITLICQFGCKMNLTGKFPSHSIKSMFSLTLLRLQQFICFIQAWDFPKVTFFSYAGNVGKRFSLHILWV